MVSLQITKFGLLYASTVPLSIHYIYYSGSHLEILLVLRLLHLWSTKTPVGKAQDELKVSIFFGEGRRNNIFF